MTTSSLSWNRQFPGHYHAELDGSTGVLRWIIARTADRRWEVVSVTTGWERRRHGATHTLREAKEVVGNFHRSDAAQTAARVNA